MNIYGKNTVISVGIFNYWYLHKAETMSFITHSLKKKINGEGNWMSFIGEAREVSRN